MDQKTTAKYKKRLMEERQRLLTQSTATKRKQDFEITTDDLADEGDISSMEQTQGVVFSLLDREYNALKDIESALERIEDGTYGCCEDCDGEIGAKRLEVFPTARYCVQHQEERERKKKSFVA